MATVATEALEAIPADLGMGIVAPAMDSAAAIALLLFTITTVVVDISVTADIPTIGPTAFIETTTKSSFLRLVSSAKTRNQDVASSKKSLLGETPENPETHQHHLLPVGGGGVFDLKKTRAIPASLY